MCNDCFYYEITWFPAKESYDDFRISFDDKLKSGTIKFIKYFPGEMSKSKFKIFGIGFGGDIYHDYELYCCQTCHQEWKLSIPDHAWRGFFVKGEYCSQI